MKFKAEKSGSLVDLLQLKTGASSKTKIRNLIKEGRITVNQSVCKIPAAPVAKGDEIAIEDAKKIEISLKGVIFEDKHILAIEKPAGLLSISTAAEKINTLYRQVSDYVKSESYKNKIFIVHRLDREVSGLVLFAKNEKAKMTLQENWTRVDKYYYAWVEGTPPQKEGRLESYLKENTQGNVYESHKGDGYLSITLYKVLFERKGMSLLQIRIETGRKHQIRVQLFAIGCPVVGDERYGAETNPFKRIGLHAFSLKFPHPETGEWMELESKLPKIFEHSI